MINSAFFLWLLSTALVVMGGGYITNHLQCLRDARSIMDHRNAVLLELKSRSSLILDAVDRASSSQELYSAVGTKGGGNDPLSKMPYDDLLVDYANTLSRVDQDDLPYPDIEHAKVEWMMFTSKEIRRRTDRAIEIALGKAVPAEAEADFRLSIDKLVREFDLTAQNFNYGTDYLSFYIHPDCSILNVTLSLAGYEPPIVRATYNNVFDVRGEFRVIEAKLATIRAAIEGKDTIAKPH